MLKPESALFKSKSHAFKVMKVNINNNKNKINNHIYTITK